MIDYQQLKGERTEYLNALATFLQSAAPLLQMEPAAKPFLLQLLQWGLAGFKGSSEIEGVIDRAIDAAQKQQQNQQDKPSPEESKAKLDMQAEQQKQQGELAKIQAKAEADRQARMIDMQADIQTAHEQHIRKVAEVNAAMQAKIAETKAALQADLLMEQAQANSNILQTQATVEGEMQKDILTANLDMQTQQQKTNNEIEKIIADARAAVNQAAVEFTLDARLKEREHVQKKEQARISKPTTDNDANEDN